MRLKLKDDLLLGVASSATQIEGGDENNNWARFAAEGKIRDGTSPLRANDHYNRFCEDIDLMAEMGITIYRFGIEWSRIEPERGCFNEEALAHYREEITYMLEKGIRPMMTIHHFTNPLWFEDMGAFESKESVDCYMAFVKKVIEAFGDLVADYITINEPNVYATQSLFFGEWPPEKRSLSSLLKAFSNLTACHIAAYNYIHKARREKGYTDTAVGFADHLRVFVPKDPRNLWHRTAAFLTDWLFQGAITDAMMTGRCRLPVMRHKSVKKGRYYDFIGINYYARSSVSGIGDGVAEDAFKNDLGWELYPQGLIELSDKLYAKYKAPVYVTENGTCDNSDAFRSRFLYDQLEQICNTDNPITRYYHWSFTDNFEWREGETPRFGLVHIDYDTQARTVKDSGKLYASIIRHRGVTQEAYDTYVVPQKYHK
ncbi:MAG: glycosyl hydrolase family protein [Ruminococcaceae bacterium]|nr:glycosyl hydrolase family protein [Oscillospiraceae bacterium]